MKNLFRLAVAEQCQAEQAYGRRRILVVFARGKGIVINEPSSVRDLMLRVTGIDIERCPLCQQGTLRLIAVLPPAPLPWDTS